MSGRREMDAKDKNQVYDYEIMIVFDINYELIKRL